MNDLIHYHDFKHHLLSDLKWLEKNKGEWDEVIELDLKSIGNSQLDFYIGNLSSENIKADMSAWLRSRQLYQKDNYKDWINENGGFREVKLSDNSVWTLRIIEKESFIHIHPSRYSTHTMRIKANTLKTVLCTLLFEDIDTFAFNIESVNYYRDKYLDLSLVKVNGNHNELEAVFSLFTDKKKNER